MTKILLFDFDGTLADSFENFLKILETLSVKHNLPRLTREELEKLRVDDAKTVMRRLKIPFYKIPFLARDMKLLQKQQMTQIKPIKGLPEVLHKLKENGYQLGIVTSNGKENVERFITLNAIDNFFYIHSDTSIFGKDTVLRNFLKKNNLSKEDVFYIGDEIRDIQACQKVGIKIIAVTWGFNAKEGLSKHHPDFLIDTPEDLLQVLDKTNL